MSRKLTASLARMDWQNSSVNTSLIIFHRVRLKSSLTGSSFLSVPAKSLWFGRQCDSGLGSDRPAESRCFVTQPDSVFGSDRLVEERF